MKKLNSEKLRQVRLEVAINLAISTDGDPIQRQKLLETICQADPLIKTIMEAYGVPLLSESEK